MDRMSPDAAGPIPESRWLANRIRTVLVAVGLCLIVLLTAYSTLPPSDQPPGQPSGVSHFQAFSVIVGNISITVQNAQAVGSGTYDQKISIDSWSFRSIINASWSNVKFIFQNGTAIQAWVESGASNTSTATVVWLRLFNIPASTTRTIFMDVLSGSGSTVMSGINGPTGEAPQLSGSYAANDNGWKVFPVYDNFSGTALKAAIWTNNTGSTGGTANVHNGLTITSETLATAKPAIVSVTNFTKPQYAGVFVDLPTTCTNVAGVGFGWNFPLGKNQFDARCTASVNRTVSITTAGVATTVSTGVTGGSFEEENLMVNATTGDDCTQENYGTLHCVGTKETWNNPLNIGAQAATTGGISVEWIRTMTSNFTSLTTVSGGTNVPSPPTSLAQGAATKTTIGVNWNAPGGTIANYTLYVTAAGGTCGTWSQQISVGSSPVRTVTGLATGSNFCMQVSAWNASGQSLLSNQLTAATLPGPVTGVSVSSVAVTSFHVAWTNPTGNGLINDSIAVTTTACTGSWTYSSIGVATSANVGSLAGATNYCIAIAAYTLGGAGTPTVFTNQTTLPGTPSGLTVSSVTTTSISLSWVNPPNALVNSTVYRWTGATCTGTVTATSIGAPALSNTQSGLTTGQEYSFEVAAWSSAGSSATTSCVQGETDTLAPTGLSVSSFTTTSISLSWTNPAAPGGISNNTVYRWTGSSCIGTVTSTSLGTSGTSNTQSGLSGATSYSFEVAAWGLDGSSATSSCVTGTTLPTAPTGLSLGSITGTSITATWSNPSGTIANNSVFRWTASSCTGTVTTTSLGSAGTSSVQSGLTLATTYSFEVAAYSASGGSAPSSCVSATTLGVPPAPTGLTVTAFAVTTISLSWTDHGTGLINNTVWYGTSCGALSSTLSTGGSATSASVTGLSGATSYCLAVSSWNSTGNSLLSSTVSQVTLPGTPTALAASGITSTTIPVSWVNPSGTLSNLTVLVGTSCGAPSQRNSVGVVTSYTITSLTASTAYCIGAQAYSSSGPGGVIYINATTTGGSSPSHPPAAPTHVTVSGITESTVTVIWKNPAGPLTRISVYYGFTCPVLTGNYTSSAAVVATISGLLSGTTFCFEVAAWNSTGRSNLSAPVLATTSVPGGGGGGSGGGGGQTGGNGTPSPNPIVAVPVDPTILEVAGILIAVAGALVIYPGRNIYGLFLVIIGVATLVLSGILFSGVV